MMVESSTAPVAITSESESAAVACITFGMGLFFLNSYPVWADRLNNISMYGSRGTLVPVIALLVLMVAAIVAGIVSCFTQKEGKAK